MGDDITNVISASGKKAQYDIAAKTILARKSILAHILVYTIDEFKGMSPKDVIQYIEGEPYINVPVEPGLTNQGAGDRIAGLNTENYEINEGMIRFDIIFYVRMIDGLSQMIINVESQKGLPTTYKLLNRAIFYVCRLVSSQKGRDFVKSNYDDIKRVASIFICMNMPEDTLDFYHLKNEKALGSYQWDGKLDMLNIVFVGLAKDFSEQKEKNSLHRLLGALFSQKLTEREKLNIIKDEYDIQIDDNLRKDVCDMSNLGQGLVEETIIETTEKVTKALDTKYILNMYNKGYAINQIADITEKDEKMVRDILAHQGLVTV